MNWWISTANKWLTYDFWQALTSEMIWIRNFIASYTDPCYQGSWGQHGAHLGPTGPSWAPCWPHELCYLGQHTWLRKGEVILASWSQLFHSLYSLHICWFRQPRVFQHLTSLLLIDIDWHVSILFFVWNLSVYLRYASSSNLFSSSGHLHVWWWPFSVYLTHWGWEKMAAILQTDIFKCILLNKNYGSQIKISLKFVPKGPNNRRHICITQLQLIKICIILRLVFLLWW